VSDWVVWLVLTGGLLVAELLTLTLVLGLLAGAALVTAGAAAVGLPLAGQVAVFGASAAGGYMLVRPFERLHRRSPSLATGTAAMVGRRAVVTVAVGSSPGRVTIGSESWLARSLILGLTYDVGTSVVVNSIDGATVVVSPEEL